jgi:hypothetical protein
MTPDALLSHLFEQQPSRMLAVHANVIDGYPGTTDTFECLEVSSLFLDDEGSSHTQIGGVPVCLIIPREGNRFSC